MNSKLFDKQNRSTTLVNDEVRKDVNGTFYVTEGSGDTEDSSFEESVHESRFGKQELKKIYWVSSDEIVEIV